MWPFKKHRDLPRIRKDEKGNIFFDLTYEEKQAVERVFKEFEGLAFHRDIADDFQRGMIAFALSNYVKGQVMLSEVDSRKKDKDILIEKAIAAISKAYSFYQLPIYLYDFACFIEMSDRIDVARDAFRDFLKKQSEFKSGQFDEIFLKERNIDEAIKDAKAKAR